MRVTIIAGLVAVATAVPMARLPRRDLATSMFTETVYTTVRVPVTLWVDESGNPVATSVAAGNFVASTTSVPAVATSTSTILTSSTTTMVSSTSAAEQVQPPTSSYVAPVTPSTTTPPAPSTTTTTQAPSPTFSTIAANTNSNSGSTGNTAVSASASNMCQGAGDACLGDITYYDTGMGACGWIVGPNDMSIALPVGMMGDKSNDNPYCGKSLTIQNPTTGKTIQATVADKCAGCEGRSIDLTPGLFAAIGGGCDGRCKDFEWWFN